jgi:integrase
MDFVILTYLLVFLITGPNKLTDLKLVVRELVLGSKVPATWASYEQCWSRYIAFCSSIGVFHSPPDAMILSLFFTSLYTNGLKYKTILRYTSALRMWFSDAGFEYPAGSFLLDSVLEELRKQSGPPNKKKAIRVFHLEKVAVILSHCSYIDLRNWVILLLFFFGLLRISKVVKLRWCDIRWDSDGIWLSIAPSKKQLTIEFVPIV